MEEKKFDYNSIIGFVLIAGILAWMLYLNPGTDEATVTDEPAAVEADTTATSNETVSLADVVDETTMPAADTGVFAQGESQSTGPVVIENDLGYYELQPTGGYFSTVQLKDFTTYKGEPLYMIKDGNADFNLVLNLKNGKTLNSRDLQFEPKVTKTKGGQTVIMRASAGADRYLEYVYTFKDDDYMMDFAIRSRGLGDVLDQNKDHFLSWELNGYRHAKSISYSKRYTEIKFEYDGDNYDYTGQSEVADEEEEDVSWIAYKQHFFSSILLSDQHFREAKMVSTDMSKDEKVDTTFVRKFNTVAPLDMASGDLNYTMDWYFGPNEFDRMSSYDRNLDEIVPLGWGIFGWINRYLFIPLFDLLSSFIGSYGLIIIVMTILVRLALSPVLYKSYLAQAKMRILRPEINAINEKYKDDSMKRQQATMKLQSSAGASPLSGCLPALIQLPVFYALFTFFPSAFQLRQEPFLWADDLSSYDQIATLPFSVPFYGDHVALFPILAAIAIFFYMLLTTGQSMQQSQPGMPNMKFLLYLSPIAMLFFFNNYASGLSLYYFISNLISIGIMLVIKYVIIDEKKVLSKIETARAKPRKQSKFGKKFSEMMEQAQEQQAAQKKGKKK